MFKFEGDSGFRFYNGGPGMGSILFDERGVRAIPPVEASFRSLSSGRWRRNERPIVGKPGSDDFGTSSAFLLIYAYLISDRAITKEYELYRPASDPDIAWSEIRLGSLFSSWARHVRLDAMTRCGALTSGWDLELVSSSRFFVAKCDQVMASKTSLANAKQVYGDRIKGLIERVERLHGSRSSHDDSASGSGEIPEVRSEILELCRVIERAAAQADGIPKNVEVRQFLALHELPQIADKACATNSFGEFLKIAGFGWLPNEKGGRPRKMGKNDRH